MSAGQITLLILYLAMLPAQNNLVDRHLTMSTGQINVVGRHPGHVAGTDNLVDHHLWRMSPGTNSLVGQQDACLPGWPSSVVRSSICTRYTATRMALVSGDIVSLYKTHDHQDGLSLW